MLILDRREDGMEKELSRFDVEVCTTELDYADLRFTGHGEHGDAIVGCERKKLGDLIGCMKDRRLSGFQLRGLWQTHDYVYLITEGYWRPGPSGEIEHMVMRQGKFTWQPYYSPSDRYAVSYQQLSAYLNSLSLRSRSISGEPLRVIRTAHARETAAQYVALYNGFQKPWKDHHAHDQIYTPAVQANGNRRGGLVQATVTTCWKWAAQLPGVDRKAEMVANHFGSCREMVLAGLDPEIKRTVMEWFEANPQAAVKAWQQIKSAELTKAGRRKSGIGKETAESVIKAIVEVGG